MTREETEFKKKRLIEYLEHTYSPRAVLVYGSYARGDNDEYSDFDCMLIADEKIIPHDDSVVDGVRLDCFIFTPDETADGELDAFLTAYDAEIVRDDGTAANLKARVRSYVDGYAADEDEKRLVKGWIAKTVERMKKDDEEGAYRGILLLSESLSDYCLLRDIFYFGSKQTISRLKNEDAEGYRLFRAAVTGRTNGEIAAWALYAAGISEESGKTDE